MDFDAYRNAYFTDPAPPERFSFTSMPGVALFFSDFEGAVNYYTDVLGPPGYVEGESTAGWRIGTGWLTLLAGTEGAPRNVEILIEVATPAEADRLQAAFIAAGGTGPEPSDQLMYAPIRSCPVTDPFGTDLMIIAPLPTP